MSIKYSLYDLYTFLIPGIIYFYTINESLALFNLPNFELSKLSNLAYLILWILATYLLGHAFFAIGFKYLYRGRSDRIPQEALESFKSWNPKFNIEFDVDDEPQLYAILKMRDIPSVAFEPIQRARVNHQMFLNSFQGLLLLGILQVAQFISKGFMIYHLVIGIMVLILSWIFYSYSWGWHKFYYYALYRSALVYGNSLEKVLINDQLKWNVSDIQDVFIKKKG